MLTESELAWLNERKIILSCEGCYIWDGYWEDGVELKTMQDAAEFEGKVAAKLANPQWAVCKHGDSCIEFGGHKDEQWVWNCEWCRHKYARLEVEEEMDADGC